MEEIMEGAENFNQVIVEDDGLSWDSVEESTGEENATETENTLEVVPDQDGEEIPSESGEEATLIDEDSAEEEGEIAPEGDTEKGAIEAPDKIDLESFKDKLVSVKINGEEVDVPLQELLNNYSGKVAYDKKFTEVDKEKKALQSEIADVNNHIEEFGKLFEEKKVLDAVSKFASFADIPAHRLKNALMQELGGEYQRLSGLSAEQYALEMQQKENEYLKGKIESDSKMRLEEQAKMELQTKVSQFQETHNISPDEWESASSLLKEHEHFKGREIAPEVITEYVRYYKAGVKSESLIKDVDASLVGNEHIMKTLSDIIINNPDFSDDDLNEIVKNAYSQNHTEEVKEKLVKKVEQKSGLNKKQSIPKDISGIKPLESWDDF